MRRVQLVAIIIALVLVSDTRGATAVLNLVVTCYCVRVLFLSGKVRHKVFDDHEEARLFSNAIIMRPNVDDVHLWEL